MTMYAKMICDSIANGVRLSTMELYYPLMIHAQLMTHRMFSRNAQSNRAMPVAKMLNQVENNPAMPSHWGKNQAGMQADEEVLDIEDAKDDWRCASRQAMYWTKQLEDKDLHKQVANRLTMPFQYIKVIVTATEWDNFFKLRLNDADPTHRELAGKMKQAMDESEPTILLPGEWHLPYIQPSEFTMSMFLKKEHLIETISKCSAARCARVSYNNHDNTEPNISKDIDLANRLLKDGHMSPFEHVATPMAQADVFSDAVVEHWDKGVTHMDRDENLWSGNFRGWVQYRQLL